MNAAASSPSSALTMVSMSRAALADRGLPGDVMGCSRCSPCVSCMKGPFNTVRRHDCGLFRTAAAVALREPWARWDDAAALPHGRRWHNAIRAISRNPLAWFHDGRAARARNGLHHHRRRSGCDHGRRHCGTSARLDRVRVQGGAMRRDPGILIRACKAVFRQMVLRVEELAATKPNSWTVFRLQRDQASNESGAVRRFRASQYGRFGPSEEVPRWRLGWQPRHAWKRTAPFSLCSRRVDRCVAHARRTLVQPAAQSRMPGALLAKRQRG